MASRRRFWNSKPVREQMLSKQLLGKKQVADVSRPATGLNLRSMLKTEECPKLGMPGVVSTLSTHCFKASLLHCKEQSGYS